MGLRKTILATEEIYHVFNRSAQNVPIFKGEREYLLFLEATRFYLQENPPTRFSIYRTSKANFPIKLESRLVTIICFCLMPNHFHFILRQEKDNGIKQFIQKLTNSFAHYFILKYKTSGHIFGGNFKAVRIENENQLLHLSRYIHLNPVTAYLVKNPGDYPYSSYLIYLEKQPADFVDSSIVMGHFSKPEHYKNFVLSQKEYQRTLKEIGHLLLE
jgi:putative transposase